MAGALTAIGDDLEQLTTVLDGWGKEIRARAGYLSGGPDSLTR